MPPRSRKVPAQRVLTDPRAIRAVAHPARLTALDALGDGVELTATALAAAAGISPSAMSYHLRELEKWGFVERADPAGDGRERPWRAVAGGWRVDTMPDAASAAATSAVTKVALERLAADLERWFAVERHQPKAWRNVSSVSNRQRWMTPAELAELQEHNERFLSALDGRSASDHPPGARRVRVTSVTVPLQFD